MLIRYGIHSGGTAGSVIGARLAEYLPKRKVLVIEAGMLLSSETQLDCWMTMMPMLTVLTTSGPSDYNDKRVLNLKEWLSLLGGDLDYDYPTTEQPMGLYSHTFDSTTNPSLANQFSSQKAIPISAIPGLKCLVDAALTTPSSHTAPSSVIWMNGPPSVLRVGTLKLSLAAWISCGTRSSQCAPSVIATSW